MPISKKLITPIILVGSLLTSCTTINNAIHGRNEAIDIGGGRYEITVSTESSGLKAGRAEIYQRWDDTAIKACNGGKYKILKRNWLSPNCLSGEIRCLSRGKR
jgi:hypothetical protein